MFKGIVLGFIGVSSGILVSAGLFAFISMIGLIPRLASRTHTAKYIVSYEKAVIWGGTIGCIIYLFDIVIPLGVIGNVLYGLGAGMFVGCLAVALAEILNTFPIFALRVSLKKGMPYIALALALGKMAGSIYGLIVMGK